MAPKGALTQAQKLEKILAYFHESQTCHTLKDLESALPTATKINKMQIKDLIKELTDSNQVKVEKIGSGNWYWAWAGEELAEKQNAVTKLESEKAFLEKSVISLQQRLEQLKSAHDDARHNPKYRDLLSQVEVLETEVKELCNEKGVYDNKAITRFENRQQECEAIKDSSRQLADNIDAIEGWFLRLYHGDINAIDNLRSQCYGEAHVCMDSLDDSD